MTLQMLAQSPDTFVSPAVAAPLLGCSPYALNLQAKAAQASGHGTIGFIRFFFAGRNLRLCKLDILQACGWTK